MKKKTLSSFIVSISIALLMSVMTYAQPYGQGLYNENVAYGDQTSLSITTDGDIDIPITPTTEGLQSTGTSRVTVTSTDVEGFKLYIRALDDTNMDNLGALLPASANTVPAPLLNNTWGYNLDASNDFIGITLNDILIRSVTVPVPLGDSTDVTFGVKLDLSKPAGNYTTTVVYTAVPQSY